MKGGGSVTKYAVGGLICILFAAAVARSPVAEAAGRDEPATEIYVFLLGPGWVQPFPPLHGASDSRWPPRVCD